MSVVASTPPTLVVFFVALALVSPKRAWAEVAPAPGAPDVVSAASCPVAWVVSEGITASHFPVAGRRFQGEIVTTHGVLAPAELADRSDAWNAWGPALGVRLFPVRVLYLGAEGEAGGVLNTQLVPVGAGLTMPAPSRPGHFSGMLTLGAIAGVSVPVWPLDLSLEVLAGFRALVPKEPWTETQVVRRIEPRVGLGVWLTSWTTLRAVAGVEPSAQPAVTASLLFEFHMRTYDGFFPRRRTSTDGKRY
jgi:hypothetical protein